MKERPILFSAPMVRALLDGSKTQTRRALKMPHGLWETSASGELVPIPANCPYGRPGDQLWVREAIRLVPDQEPDDGTGRVLSVYGADGSLTAADAWPWKRSYLPPMHCPRGLSRIDLEITDVRVERLQDISEADARAEGASFHDGRGIGHSGWRHDHGDVHADARSAYARLWEQINGAGSWAANPWVWVVEFRRVRP